METLKKIQKIGNVIFLVVFIIAIIWMKIDYENKINDLTETFDKELQGIQYSIIDSNERTALSVNQLNEQISILDGNILSVKNFIEEKLNK